LLSKWSARRMVGRMDGRVYVGMREVGKVVG
jgi:hypothetical protein